MENYPEFKEFADRWNEVFPLIENRCHDNQIFIWRQQIYWEVTVHSNHFLSIWLAPRKGWVTECFFLISQSKNMLWVLKRTVSLRRFF